VVTSAGAIFVVPIARSKQRRAAVASPRGETNTSMTCPNWSMAPVEVAPLAGDLHRRLVDLPAISN
jgi:hypothetical protein